MLPVEAQISAWRHRRSRRQRRHSAVFERAGRVRALELQPDLDAGLFGQALGEDERSRPLVQRHHGVGGLERQAFPVALNDPRHWAGGCQSRLRRRRQAPPTNPQGAAGRRRRQIPQGAAGRRRRQIPKAPPAGAADKSPRRRRQAPPTNPRPKRLPGRPCRSRRGRRSARAPRRPARAGTARRRPAATEPCSIRRSIAAPISRLSSACGSRSRPSRRRRPRCC